MKNTWSPLAAAAGINIECNILGENHAVKGDPDVFFQMLSNLVKNAIEAADTAEMSQITLSVVQSEKSVVVEVMDDGPGLPHRHPPGATVKSTKPNHQGIGLSFVAKMAQRFGADFTYLENAGGAVFRLSFPYADPRKHILVIEDDPEIREILGAALRDNGQIPILVEDGEQGLAKFDDSIDGIIADMKLPGMDGIEFYHQVHNRRKVPTLFYSGEESFCRRAQSELPEVPLMTKPCSHRRLIHTLLGQIP